jgi:hypothetical protein
VGHLRLFELALASSAITRRIQPVSATPSNLTWGGRCGMVTSRIWFTAAQKAELQSYLKQIALEDSFDKKPMIR